MTTELTDMLEQLDQRRGRSGRFVGDNVCVSPSLIAKAAFVCAPAKPFEIELDARKLASFRGVGKPLIEACRESASGAFTPFCSPSPPRGELESPDRTDERRLNPGIRWPLRDDKIAKWC